MGSPSAIVTLGYGTWGSVNEVITLGYGIGEEAAAYLPGDWPIIRVEPRNRTISVVARDRSIGIAPRNRTIPVRRMGEDD